MHVVSIQRSCHVTNRPSADGLPVKDDFGGRPPQMHAHEGVHFLHVVVDAFFRGLPQATSIARVLPQQHMRLPKVAVVTHGLVHGTDIAAVTVTEDDQDIRSVVEGVRARERGQ